MGMIDTKIPFAGTMFYVVSSGVLLAATLAASPGDVVVRPVEGDATVVLQRAFDRCFRAGGGTVVVEKGGHAVGGLRIRSNTTLLLKRGIEPKVVDADVPFRVNPI